jgi:hypothetical protein
MPRKVTPPRVSARPAQPLLALFTPPLPHKRRVPSATAPTATAPFLAKDGRFRRHTAYLQSALGVLIVALGGELRRSAASKSEGPNSSGGCPLVLGGWRCMIASVGWLTGSFEGDESRLITKMQRPIRSAGGRVKVGCSSLLEKICLGRCVRHSLHGTQVVSKATPRL